MGFAELSTPRFPTSTAVVRVRVAPVRLGLWSDDTAWGALEAALNQRTQRVYDLMRQRVRLDTTSASSYWAVTEEVW